MPEINGIFKAFLCETGTNIKILLNMVYALYLIAANVVQYTQLKYILLFLRRFFVGNIIYRSAQPLPWDTQSAFKLTSYKSGCEDTMVFCYLKGYIHGDRLVLCSYCFVENPGEEKLALYLRPNGEKAGELLCVEYGFEGIKDCFAVTENGEKEKREFPDFSSFKSDDEQGFYWCGEITLPLDDLDSRMEKGENIICLNLVLSFPGGDFAALCPDVCRPDYSPEDNLEVFVVLNY